IVVLRLLSWLRSPVTPATSLITPRLYFAWYLFLIGLLAALGYVATRPLGLPIDRYYLLALFLPVGLIALVLATESNRKWRTGISAAVLLWAIGSGVDHFREADPYLTGRMPNRLRLLADELVARQIRVAAAPYWRAYKLTFMTAEKLKVAAADSDRI